MSFKDFVFVIVFDFCSHFLSLFLSFVVFFQPPPNHCSCSERFNEFMTAFSLRERSNQYHPGPLLKALTIWLIKMITEKTYVVSHQVLKYFNEVYSRMQAIFGTINPQYARKVMPSSAISSLRAAAAFLFDDRYGERQRGKICSVRSQLMVNTCFAQLIFPALKSVLLQLNGILHTCSADQTDNKHILSIS